MTGVLIVGYGRAGKRWANLCLSRGYTVMVYDPMYETYPKPIIPIHSWIVDTELCDFAIICTPPNLHLKNIKSLFNLGITNVLCEKPLCSIGEIDQAKDILKDDIAVAYNYNYHEVLTRGDQSGSSTYKLICEQQRDLPKWGLLLDHCSHDLDIARHFLGDTVYVESAYHQVTSGLERWFITLANDDNNHKFLVEETVFQYRKVSRKAILESWSENGSKSGLLTADPKMFERLLDAFLGGMRNSRSALITQRLLEETYAKTKVEPA